MRTIYCKSTGETVNSYKDYLKTNHWKKKKQSFLATVKRQCMECGSKSNLHVHHLTYKNVGNERNSQLCLLCKDCHFAAHKKGKEKLDEIKSLRKIQRKIDIMRIRHGKNWLQKFEFNSVDEYIENLIKQQERTKKSKSRKSKLNC